jgi:CRISPR system Cascade subunit CasE
MTYLARAFLNPVSRAVLLARLPAGYFLDLADDFDLAATGPSENPAVREVDKERDRIAVGDSFAFRLRANTTKKIPKVDAEAGTRTKNGTRVPVRGDEEWLRWLGRHAAAAGFHVAGVQVTEIPARSGRGPRDLTFAGAVYEGRLQVTEAGAFRTALASGIGPGKAFGFGLLSIQRAR